MTYRNDIDGLRCFAVISVLLFHTKIPLFRGGFVGVDVFFVISGFLIAGLLLRELDAKGSIDFKSFWARRCRRLVPSAIVVIILTLFASFLFLPSYLFSTATKDGIYAALYVANWQKLWTSVQYFQGGDNLQLFLHYWSLAVEEQFYVIVSSAFAVTTLLHVHFKARWNLVYSLAIVLSSIGLLSLGSYVWSLNESLPLTFFATHNRIWQLLSGSAVAFIVRRGFRPSAIARSLLSGSSILLITFSVFIFEGGRAQNAMHTIIPTLGAVCFILAGFSADSEKLPFFNKILSSKIPVAIGKASYSIYLFHFPVFILTKQIAKQWEIPEILTALFVTGLAASLNFRFLEQPVRTTNIWKQRHRSTIAFSASVTALVAFLSFLAFKFSVQNQYVTIANRGSIAAQELREKKPSIYFKPNRCHLREGEIKGDRCTFGDLESQTKIFLFGNSHAAQWFPPLEVVAREKNWMLFSRTKSQCSPFEIIDWGVYGRTGIQDCKAWRSNVLDEIEKERPAAVFITRYDRKFSLKSKKMKPMSGFLEVEWNLIQRIRAIGAEVFMISDTPRQSVDPIDCLIANPGHSDRCRTSRVDALPRIWMKMTDEDRKQAGVYEIDLTEELCGPEFCPVIIENTVGYSDKGHLSPDLVLNFNQVLDRKISEARISVPSKPIHANLKAPFKTY